MSGLTYKDAGVDISAADDFVDSIASVCRSTFDGRVVPATAAFAGLVRAPVAGMKAPLVAASCDGVGTKLLVAQEMKQYRGLGQDLVAMNVNDLLCVGARPLLFLDYLATGKLEPAAMHEIVAGAAAACARSGCVLLGGETAEMPGLYAPGHFDLAGFAVGLVDESQVPRGGIAPGDVLLALPSHGVHANGFSLVRKALARAGYDLHAPAPGWKVPLGEELLRPTAIYVPEVLALGERVTLKACAHITGGGLLGRLLRLTPGGLSLRVDPERFERPKIFDLIQEAGHISEGDLVRTFNMGLGFCAVVSPEDAEKVHQDNPDGWRQVGHFIEGASAFRHVHLGTAESEVPA